MNQELTPMLISGSKGATSLDWTCKTMTRPNVGFGLTSRLAKLAAWQTFSWNGRTKSNNWTRVEGVRTALLSPRTGSRWWAVVSGELSGLRTLN